MKILKKKKLRESIIVGTAIAAVILPVSVYAALPNLGAIEQQLPSEVRDSEAYRTGKDVLLQVQPIVSTTQDIFRIINSGDIEGAFKRILGLLGDLGLVDPAYEASRVGIDPESPYYNPQTPEQIYEWQRNKDVARTETGQRVSQIVFGKQGQEALFKQNQAVSDAQQASQSGQIGVFSAYQQSTQQAQQNATYAENVKAKGDEAKSAIVSQDVLKAIAAQNEDLAKIGSGNSAQLAQLGKAASYQSAQLSATNVQLTALNDKTQTLAALSASQNYQTAQINAAIERQSHYEQVKDSLQQNTAYQASNLMYIPGLVPK